MAEGIPDELYWRLTPAETRALLRRIYRRREREAEAALLRAGLVAAAIYNVHRKRGKPPIMPRDFLPEEPKVVTPRQALMLFRAWAERHNRALAQRRGAA